MRARVLALAASLYAAPGRADDLQRAVVRTHP